MLHLIKCTDSDLVAELLDSRTISVPLMWFLRLSQATQKQLTNGSKATREKPRELYPRR